MVLKLSFLGVLEHSFLGILKLCFGGFETFFCRVLKQLILLFLDRSYKESKKLKFACTNQILERSTTKLKCAMKKSKVYIYLRQEFNHLSFTRIDVTINRTYWCVDKIIYFLVRCVNSKRQLWHEGYTWHNVVLWKMRARLRLIICQNVIIEF